MNFEDEPYIKWYTRPTPEFLALSVQARGLLPLICSVVDRAGILKVGKLGLKGVAIALHTRWKEIESSVNELIEDGRIVFDPSTGAVLVPNHIEAQSSRTTDAARKQRSRDNARTRFRDIQNGGVNGGPEGGYVYFVREVGGDTVKIGHTYGPVEARLSGLQVSSPRPLEIVRHIRGVEGDEKALHVRFEDYRIRGEWFRFTGALEAFVDAIQRPPVTPCPAVTGQSHPSRDAVTLDQTRLEETRSDPPLPPEGVLGTPPRTTKLPGLLGMELERFRLGVAAGTNRPCAAFEPRALVHLLAGAQAFAPPAVRDSADALGDWFEADATAFVRATSHSPQFQKGYHPSKWVEWHNAGCPDGKVGAAPPCPRSPSRSAIPDLKPSPRPSADPATGGIGGTRG